MICPRCTALIADDYLYCPRCGQSTAPREAGADSAPPSPDPASPPAPDVPSSPGLKAQVTKKPDSEWKAHFFALSEEEIGSLLTQANLYRVRRQWAEAIEKCVTVLRAQPGNASAHALLGDIYRDQGNPAEAVQWYRMAVDLQPNPSDESKLHQMEQESARSAVRTGGAKTPPVSSGALAAAGGVPGGTSALMGLSPRRWLNTITLIALAFLAVMALGLFALKTGAERGAPVPQPLPQEGASNALTDRHANDILPPIRPRGATILPPGEQGRDTRPTNSVGGSGMPPDQSPTSTPTAPPAPSKGSDNRGSDKTGSNVPPASVGQVRPLQNPAQSSAQDTGGVYMPVPYESHPRETKTTAPRRSTAEMSISSGP